MLAAGLAILRPNEFGMFHPFVQVVCRGKRIVVHSVYLLHPTLARAPAPRRFPRGRQPSHLSWVNFVDLFIVLGN
jgi:hypothetical protein